MNIATTLILGGARSGKSQFAQALAESVCEQPIFVATAEARDDEMSERIARHVAERGDIWEVVEAPILLCEAITEACSERTAVLVDCLTLWLSNITLAGLDVEAELQKLKRTIETIETPLVLVSNEVGMGIVPESPLGRQFRDAQGRLNREVASVCRRVEFIVAGLPMTLKG